MKRPGRPTRAQVEAEKRFVASVDLRPKPPAHYKLTADETKIWDNIVNGQPPGWFTSSNYPLLVQLCRLTDRAQVMSGWAEEAKAAGNQKSYLKWSRSEGSLTRYIIAASNKLRINNSSGLKAKPILKRLAAEQGTVGKPLAKVTPWGAGEDGHPALRAAMDSNSVSEEGERPPANSADPAPGSVAAAPRNPPKGPEPVSTLDEEEVVSQDDHRHDDFDDGDDEPHEVEGKMGEMNGHDVEAGEKAPARPWD